MAERIVSQVLGNYTYFPDSGIITGGNDTLSLIKPGELPKKELFRVTKETSGREALAPLIVGRQPLVIVFDSNDFSQTEFGKNGQVKRVRGIKSIMPAPKGSIFS